jgi:hypothetical protein
MTVIDTSELLKSVGFADKKSKCPINSVPLSVRMSDKYAILLFSIFRNFASVS